MAFQFGLIGGIFYLIFRNVMFIGQEQKGRPRESVESYFIQITQSIDPMNFQVAIGEY